MSVESKGSNGSGVRGFVEREVRLTRPHMARYMLRTSEGSLADRAFVVAPHGCCGFKKEQLWYTKKGGPL